jgi:hypothetical protein
LLASPPRKDPLDERGVKQADRHYVITGRSNYGTQRGGSEVVEVERQIQNSPAVVWRKHVSATRVGNLDEELPIG